MQKRRKLKFHIYLARFVGSTSDRMHNVPHSSTKNSSSILGVVPNEYSSSNVSEWDIFLDFLCYYLYYYIYFLYWIENHMFNWEKRIVDTNDVLFRWKNNLFCFYTNNIWIFEILHYYIYFIIRKINNKKARPNP